MNRFKNYIKLSISLFLVLTIFINSSVGVAQTISPQAQAQANQEAADREREMLDWDLEEMDKIQAEMDAAERPWTVPRSPLIPTQSKKTGGADTINKTAGQCIGDLLADVATTWFTGMVSSVVSTVTKPTLVPVYVPGLENKEVATAGAGPSMDAIGYCLGNAVIIAVSDSMIRWINSGFDKNPSFIADPESFFKEFKEDTLDSFVDSFADGILCKEFSVKIRLALIMKERPKRQYKCTYDEAIANLENGPFSFDAYADLTSHPGNTPMGAFLSIDSNYQELLNSRKDALDTELSWGRGYFSWKDKDNPGKTITPGTFISDSLQKGTGLQFDRLVLADEFDEVLGAAINQLIRMSLDEIMGAK